MGYKNCIYHPSDGSKCLQQMAHGCNHPGTMCSPDSIITTRILQHPQNKNEEKQAEWEAVIHVYVTMLCHFCLTIFLPVKSLAKNKIWSMTWNHPASGFGFWCWFIKTWILVLLFDVYQITKPCTQVLLYYQITKPCAISASACFFQPNNLVPKFKSWSDWDVRCEGPPHRRKGHKGRQRSTSKMEVIYIFVCRNGGTPIAGS